jgi:hypothetical protein
MLTLRSTGLASPAYANWLDYVIVEAGRTVGRLYGAGSGGLPSGITFGRVPRYP